MKVPFEDPAARLAAIVSSSEDAIVSKDLNGIITSWNPSAERIFGYPASEAVGRSITMIIPTDRLAEEDFLLTEVRAGRTVNHFETVRQRRDGALIDVAVTLSPIVDAKGVVTGASKIAREITEHRRREREAYWLAAIVASSDDAIISKDLHGIIQTWNRSAERIFGFTAQEAIGRSIMIIIPDDRLSEETEVLSRIRRGELIQHFETIRHRKDGTPIEISLTVSPIRAASGAIIGASKIARDISEQRRLQQVAEDASRLKDEFLAVLSHELRTPLNTVLGYARMLRRTSVPMDEDQQSRALDVLERNADALAKLVNDVLDTSRVVTGKLRLSLTNFQLEEVVKEAIETVAPSAEAKDIQLHATLGQHLEVLADRDRLRQVLWNLLSNALKFTPSGGDISVRAAQEGPVVLIEVRDTGVGISAEHLPLVFQRFWQADTGTSREHGGLGIGLALARHLVELHGGSIVAQSDGPGAGAVFTVRLPSAAIAFARERNLRRVVS